MFKLLLRDLYDTITLRRPKNVPPTCMMFDGPIGVDKYIKNGQESMKLFKDLTNITPSSRVLDIGSGIGRKTLPLTSYLNSNGSYQGIEIVKKGVNWCQKHISSQYPNFKFDHIDIYNGFYNPSGIIKPSTFVFPFSDNSFDLIIAGSVFTHMLPDDIFHYLSEIKRVLKPYGQSFLTYFLITAQTNRVLDKLPFIKQHNYYTTTPVTPEIAIGFDQNLIKNLYKKSGNKIQKIYPGSWWGLKNTKSYQDIIVSTK